MRNLVLLLLLLCSATEAACDRLILMPTGATLPTGRFRLEGAFNIDDHRPNIAWAAVGVGPIELQAVRFHDVGKSAEFTAGVEAQLLPETMLTPAVGIGISDIADKGPNGRAEYIAATSTIPAERAPWVRSLKLHAGLGVEGIRGVFAGAQAGLPYNISLTLEFDSRTLNGSVGWSPVRHLELKAYRIKHDTYVGASFRFP